jgi:selenocysteine-specific elongation factor
LIVLDVDPPPLRRRGAAKARAAELDTLTDRPNVLTEVARRGAMTRDQLAVLGIRQEHEPLPDQLLTVGDHVVHPDTWQRWHEGLTKAVDEHHTANPLAAGLPAKSAQQQLNIPDPHLVEALVKDSGGALTARDGRITRPGSGPSFTDEVRQALDEVRTRLAADPLDSPDIPELTEAGLTTAVLAAAAKAGLILRLPGDVVLHPTAPDAATATIAELPQPFTLSEARQALSTTRRIAVPLLEHLDATGRTVRIDGSLRRVTDR